MNIRWRICFLLFLTWIISYIDRSLMPMALPFIGKEFHLKPALMGAAASAFFIGYASMQIPGGIMADKFGPRKMITAGVAVWSIFSFLTGAARNFADLISARILFGLGEGVQPPAAFKALSAWFGRSELGRANGFMMCSNTLGPMIAPAIFAVAFEAFGWRGAFYVISIPGLIVAAAAYWYLRDRPVSEVKLAKTGEGNKKRERASYSDLLRYGTLWQLFFIYMAWDAAWWGFQTWLPTYLIKARGFTLLRTGFVTALPYAAGLIGMLLAAYVSDRSGRRKVVLISVLLGTAMCLLLTATAATAGSAVVFLTATGFFLPAIQGPFWSLPMEILPSNVMGYSSGFINTGGQIAGVISPIVIGALIQMTNHYRAGFIFMALSVCVSALLISALRQPQPKAQAKLEVY